MNRRVFVCRLALALAIASVPFVAALAQDKAKPPINKYGLTLKYRKPGQDEFSKDQKYSLECFQEQETGNGMFVTLPGALSVIAKGHFKGGDGSKAPLSQHGFEIKVRPSDTKAKEPVYAVECFLDENSGDLIYLTQNGGVAVIPAKFAKPTTGKIKGYGRTHGMDLRVRKAGDKDWEKPTTKTYGIDVYEDDNNGNVIYMSETGAIAALPNALAGKSVNEKKKPEWQYGLDLKARAANEEKITKDTKAFGVEVFKDTNNGCMIYVVENGNIAVVGSKVAKFGELGKAKDPVLARGFNLSVRGLDEKDFSDKSKKHSVEVYTDENNGNTIYFTEAGQIAVVPAKEE